MSWSWILRILWARSLIILVATGASLLGGIVVYVISPPRYLASARVVLDYVKPDVTTGQYMPTKMVDAYAASQVQMIGDYQVMIPAVEAMGWLDNPDLQDAYAARPPNDRREFRQWVASRLAGSVSAHMVEDSNTLQIEFRAMSPEMAIAVVDALRQGYVQANVTQRRDGAAQRAEALTRRAGEVRTKIAALEKVKSDYEKATGLSLGTGPRDPDSARLRELAMARDHVYVPPVEGESTAAGQLAAIDARISLVGPSLGVNNAELKGMQARREILRAQVAAEQTNEKAVGNAIAQVGAARGRLLEEQKSKVLSQRDKILQLRLYQDEIDGYRAQLSSALEGAASSKVLMTADQSGLTPVGAPKAEPIPVFPNPYLILGGSSVLGLIIGVLLALLTEFMGRRVRSLTDLELAGLTPLLGVVPQARSPRERRIKPKRAEARPGAKAPKAAAA